ncbi:Ganglioside GM2 activator [Mizuhopecten yessoensis]|uniref:Ganglioside GM2 activator n=1 Tax=Mizuhopecten yessoensis TaxID=6573 RepID=A0A210PXY4_MIZYE|nr:Ganglioside GM2 activator [Mizuhopecten yessoensis]
MALDRNPKTVHKALKYIKVSVANQRALFGSGAPHYPSRQVEFAEALSRGMKNPKMTQNASWTSFCAPQPEGSHKATMLKDFVFKNCGGNTGSVFNLTITPDPIRFPGTLTISATVDLKQEISAPLTVVLDMKKDFRGDWIDIPCIANVGSCTYSSLCSDLDMATCPEELKNAGIDCRCPFKAKTYKVSSLSIPVNAAAFLSGDFKVKALVTFGDGGKYSQCIDVQFSVA